MTRIIGALNLMSTLLFLDVIDTNKAKCNSTSKPTLETKGYLTIKKFNTTITKNHANDYFPYYLKFI